DAALEGGLASQEFSAAFPNFSIKLVVHAIARAKTRTARGRRKTSPGLGVSAIGSPRRHRHRYRGPEIRSSLGRARRPQSPYDPLLDVTSLLTITLQDEAVRNVTSSDTDRLSRQPLCPDPATGWPVYRERIVESKVRSMGLSSTVCP